MKNKKQKIILTIVLIILVSALLIICLTNKTIKSSLASNGILKNLLADSDHTHSYSTDHRSNNNGTHTTYKTCECGYEYAVGSSNCNTSGTNGACSYCGYRASTGTGGGEEVEDTTPPTYSVTNEPNVNDYHQELSFTVTFEDTESDIENVNAVFVLYTLDNVEVEKSETITPDYNGKTATCTYTFKPDTGRYNVEIKVYARDTAQNTVGTDSDPKYINLGPYDIDVTDPEISKVTVSGAAVTVIANDTWSGIAGYSFDGGNTWQSSNSYTYTSIGNKTIVVKDNAGNTTSKAVTITTLVQDTVAPTLSSIEVTNPQTGTYKAGQVITIVATYSENIYADANKKNIGIATAPTLNIKFGGASCKTCGGDGQITCTGSLGAKSYYNANCDTAYGGCGGAVSFWIATCSSCGETLTYITSSNCTCGSMPVGYYESAHATYNCSSNTCTARTATFNSVSGKNITYTYTIKIGDNGILSTTQYSGTVYDEAGNALTVSNKAISGYKITADTSAPTITSVTGNPTEWTYDGVTLTINGASDSGAGLAEKPYSFDGGATWQAEATKTYSKNTNGIVIQVKDSLGNTYTHETINITKIKLRATKIEVTTMPKTEYESGEDFDSNGMVVTVTYSDGSSEATTDYTVINGKDLTCLVKEIEIQYNDNTEIKTKISITVEHDMKEATCAEKAKCKIEGCGYTQGEVLGHSFTNYISNNNATCTKDGTKTATCDRCDQTDTIADEGSKLGHNYEAKVTEPTCTEKGYTTHKCTRCGDEYVDTYTDEKGHSYTDYKSNNDATCTEDGTETATCDREGCEEKDTRVDEGSKLPHNYEDGECTDCGEEEPKATIESEKYTVLEAYITKIPDKTTFEEFKENIETNAEEIKVYNKNNQELTEEDLVATGMTLTLRLGTETRTFKLVVVGDTTGDGIADFKDVVSINTHRLHKTTLSGEFLMAGDVTEDNKVEFKDIVKINRYRLNKILQLFKII